MESKYQEFYPPFVEGARWALPASPEVVEGLQTLYAAPDSYPVGGRGRTFNMAFFSAKHLGAGQYYLMTIMDKAGRSLDGGNTYRLTVPPNPPVKQYWSATAYDRATHALIRNTRWSSRSSQTPGLKKNADGSTDVCFGPTPPAGKESNWVPRAQTASSKCCSDSTDPRRRCSIRPGGFLTSNRRRTAAFRAAACDCTVADFSI